MSRRTPFPLSCLPLFAATLAACGASDVGTTPRTGDVMVQQGNAREERASLEAVLRRYEAALNTADAAAAVEVYADDAVFMAQTPCAGEGARRDPTCL